MNIPSVKRGIDYLIHNRAQFCDSIVKNFLSGLPDKPYLSLRYRFQMGLCNSGLKHEGRLHQRGASVPWPAGRAGPDHQRAVPRLQPEKGRLFTAAYRRARQPAGDHR